ncbi:MAG: ATP-dependent DNA helicase [Deferribacterales bacterium]
MNIKNYFEDEDFLPSVLSGYRPRKQQAEIAEFIHKSMSGHVPAVVEAPTGSGKTLSYLIPALELERKVIISTKTKQLMLQILNKDIPIASKLFGHSPTVYYLKGRRNYFCHERFFRLVYPNSSFYPDAVKWFEGIAENYVIEIPFGMFGGEIIEKMTADSYQCSGSGCQFFAHCSFYRAKEAANASDVIVTNHHLIASDIAMKSKSEFGAVFDFAEHVIFDEAHALPDIYPQFAGSDINLRSFMSLIRENKAHFSPKDVETATGAYNTLLAGVKESRMLLEQMKGDVDRYIETVFRIIEDKTEKEIKDPFTKLKAALVPIRGDEEGVRLCEAGAGSFTVKFIPLTAGDNFREGLKGTCISPLFISATLTAGDSFGYFLSELGYDPSEVNALKTGAVFDYETRGRIYVPKGLWNDKNADGIYTSLASRLEGSMLVICNSTRRMEELAALFETALPYKKVFMQGNVDISDRELETGGIFIGCNIFREGVDFAHTGLKCVVLDKLPFEYPDDAFLKQKSEKVKNNGGNPFMDFFLPRAVIYFKQAVGRLFRHEDDMGLWVVLDDRLLTKNYGKSFMDVLKNVHRVRTLSEALSFLEVCDGKDQAGL